MQTRERLNTLIGIRPSESDSTSLMIAHSFFMGMSMVFFETAASALFLAHYDAGALPWVYLAATAVSITTGLTYTRIKDRVAFAPLMTGTLLILFASVCLLRLGLGLAQTGWLIFAMMVAYRLLSILTDLEYWAVAARLYDVQQSKRLFSLIGSGEVAARISGALSVPVLVGLIGVENLFWISAFGLGACVVLLVVIFRRFPDVASGAGESETTETVPKDTRVMRSLKSARYLRFIFMLAFFAVLGKYFVDFAFLTEMQTRSREVESLASFFGVFSGITQAINLLVRFLVSGRLLSRFGVRAGLLVLPAAHILCTVAIVVTTSIPLPIVVFWLVISNQGLYKILKHPIDNPSFKILYQPLPRRDRLVAQIGVEVIVTPMAIAVGAALMLLFGHAGTVSSGAFGYVMLANFVAWALAAAFAFREYGYALVTALQKRTLDRASFSLQDKGSIALVRSKLESEYPEDVIFALDLLQRIDHPSLSRHWTELLAHPSAEVRRYVLLQIEKRRPPGIHEILGDFVGKEESPRVKAAALRALAALGDPLQRVPAYLRHPDALVERGALIALLSRRQEPSLSLARERLAELSSSRKSEERALACKVLGKTGWETPDEMLVLLDDDDVGVRQAALKAAGKRGDASVLARVIADLEEPRFRPHATRALVKAGEHAEPMLAEALSKPQISCHVRARIAGRLPNFEHHDVLWLAYDSSCEPARQEALRSLSACGHRAIASEIPTLVTRISREIEEAAWELGIIRSLTGQAEFEALTESLAEEVEGSRERVFLLLSFVFGRTTLLSARDNLESTSREKRAYATEILDVTLSQELKELTLPLLERLSPSERSERLAPKFPQPERTTLACVEELLTRPDARIRNWTRACAIYGAAHFSSDDLNLKTALTRLAEDRNPLVAETSRWALAKRRNGSPMQEVNEMLTIEKVILLKGVSMFSATSEDILADVAILLEEVELLPDELVFSKGDRGDSMYIVVSGRVRIFDGENTINFLGEREIFGELALLDPEPRSASVEAVEETRLFRLGRDTLFELMTDNIGVVSGIMQVLCRRLRRITAIATGGPR